MSFLKISNEAYEEFKQYLLDNGVTDLKIRINLAGHGWGGPAFNIVLDEQSDNDEVQVVNDLTIIAEKKLIEEFTGFTILSTEENEGRGLSLKPNLESEGGCGSCGGGCH